MKLKPVLAMLFFSTTFGLPLAAFAGVTKARALTAEAFLPTTTPAIVFSRAEAFKRVCQSTETIHAHYKLTRITPEIKTTVGFTSAPDTVCEVDADLPVFDDPACAPHTADAARCFTTIDGHPVEIVPSLEVRLSVPKQGKLIGVVDIHYALSNMRNNLGRVSYVLPTFSRSNGQIADHLPIISPELSDDQILKQGLEMDTVLTAQAPLSGAGKEK